MIVLLSPLWLLFAILSPVFLLFLALAFSSAREPIMPVPAHPPVIEQHRS
ncbi:MAG: hypothetical protein U1F27_04230 [Turneriella sp.]